MLQVADLVGGRFGWPDAIVRSLIIILAFGLIATLVLAWFHGERGQQKITLREGALLVAIVLLAGAVVSSVVKEPGDRDRLDQKNVNRSIAVLPFVNLSNSKENEYFSDGVTDDVLTALAKLNDLTVISRTSVLQYKDTKKPLKQIAEELGVAHILEGSVRRAGNRVKITAQLIDARSDRHLWAEDYDRELKDIFAIQQEIAEKIATALAARLTSEQRALLSGVQTTSLTAHDLVLRGRSYMQPKDLPRVSDADLAIAKRFFAQALEQDPDYALAHAGLAIAFSIESRDVNKVLGDSALKHGRRAVRLAPTEAEAHYSLGRAYSSDFNSARPHYEHAVQFSPNHAGALARISLIRYETGLLDEGLYYAKRAVAVEPTDRSHYRRISTIYWRMGDLGASEVWLRKALEVAPDYGSAMDDLGHVFWARNEYARADSIWDALFATRASDSVWTSVEASHVMMQGDDKRALELFERAFKNWPKFAEESANFSRYAFLLRKASRVAESEKILEARARNARDREARRDAAWAPALTYATIAAVRGDKAEMIRWLDAAFKQGLINEAGIRQDPVSRSFAGDPEFERVMSDMRARGTAMRKSVSEKGW